MRSAIIFFLLLCLTYGAAAQCRRLVLDRYAISICVPDFLTIDTTFYNDSRYLPSIISLYKDFGKSSGMRTALSISIEPLRDSNKLQQIKCNQLRVNTLFKTLPSEGCERDTKMRSSTTPFYYTESHTLYECAGRLGTKNAFLNFYLMCDDRFYVVQCKVPQRRLHKYKRAFIDIVNSIAFMPDSHK